MWYNPADFQRSEGDPSIYVIINELRLQSMTGPMGQIHQNSVTLLTTRKSQGESNAIIFQNGS